MVGSGNVCQQYVRWQHLGMVDRSMALQGDYRGYYPLSVRLHRLPAFCGRPFRFSLLAINTLITNIMNVTIESFFCPYCDEVTETYFRLVNTILFADGEDSLRQGLERLKTQVPLDDYFVYGFGAHHLWVHQRKPSDQTQYFRCRLMKAEF